MSPGAKNICYRFNDLTVDRSKFCVLKSNEALSLTPRAFDVLLYLIEARGRVVERQELFEQLWKGSFVTDNALTRVIKEIRQVIDDDADAPRYIETVPKRGYRFIAKPFSDAPGPTEPGSKSVVVLPFVSAATSPEAEYLSDGIAASIISNLSQLSSIRVLARSTVFSYKGREVTPQTVGQELNASVVLTGRVERISERLVISVELADATDGAHLWGQQYTRKFADIFEIQEEIAQEISEKLRLKLSVQDQAKLAKRHTEDPEAYQLYLKGYYWLYKFTPEGLTNAFAYFNQAIERDQGYALAHAGLVEAYFNQSFFSPPAEVWTRAKEAALKALQLDGNLAEAHYAMALVNICYDRDWKIAEQEFQRAIRLEPNYALAYDWYGWSVLAQAGRFTRAIAMIEKGIDLDPLSLAINTDYGTCLYWSRQYDRAIDVLKKTLDLEQGFFVARMFLGLAYLQMGDAGAAAKELEEARSQSNHPYASGFLGFIYAGAGKRVDALRILSDLEADAKNGYVPPDASGLIHIGLRQKGLAFERLRKGCDERTVLSLSLLVEPCFDPLRHDPRFADLLRRIRIDPVSLMP